MAKFFIAQISLEGKMQLWQGEHMTEVTSMAQVNAVVGENKLALSSTVDFANEFTTDKNVLDLARQLCGD